MPSKKQLVREKALELLRANPRGLRFVELRRALEGLFPGTTPGTIAGYIWNLHVARANEVDKPSKGLFVYRRVREVKRVPRPSKREILRDKAVELLSHTRRGFRYTELVDALQDHFPNTPRNTIYGAVWNLDVTRADHIHKPSRGLFKHKLHEEDTAVATRVRRKAKPVASEKKEEDFYAPFADWIKNDLQECTEAIPFGGNYLGKKWGTPDVVGIYKPSAMDLVKFQLEIVSAEIKISPADPITAFGQSIAYRLFSSKVYLVEPNTMSREDQDRIEALCILFGVGLILFDVDVSCPNFGIRVRDRRFTPDMYYVNEFAHKLYKAKRDVFNKLFG